MTMGHASIEVRRTQKLYRERHADSLLKIFDILNRELCPNYKLCFLYAIVRRLRPIKVVETGVASGVSSYSILQALQDNGEGALYSIDLPSAGEVQLQPGQETGFLVPERLRDRWTLMLGDSKQELPRLLKELGAIDLFIHDSLHEYDHMLFEYEEAWSKLREGGILFSDDVTRTAAFQDFCGEKHLHANIVERAESAWKGDMGWIVK